jgi:uncharacterized protein (DUF1501 family)
MPSSRPSSRRRFLHTTMGSTALVTAPGFLMNLARHAHAAKLPGNKKADNILVVVQLSGGNDGLNTVIPYGDDAYQRNRFITKIGKNQVRKINDYIGLHPAMQGMHQLYEQDKLAIVQGVGYPNPNRSHFASMDIWHTANLDAANSPYPARRTGWIGRYLDQTSKGVTDVPALHLGDERQPLAIVGKDVRVPSVSNLEGFKLQTGNDKKLLESVQSAAEAERADASELLQFMQRSTVSALKSSERVQKAVSKYKTSVKYPPSQLARRLSTVAQLIDAGLKTRIYYVSLGGFDTHAEQAGAHTALLGQLSNAISAFVADLTEHSHDQRVLVMTFSEFGRRIKENASRGTDHGTAAPMFLAGGAVKAGIIGKHPSLTNTQDGDLKHHIDFRQVYAGILKDWLHINSKKILGKPFAPVQTVKTV